MAKKIDEVMWQRKDEVMWLRTTSKFVACMNGCWDSEFNTSIEEIVCLSMKQKDSLRLPSLRSKGSEGVPLFCLGTILNIVYSVKLIIKY